MDTTSSLAVPHGLSSTEWKALRGVNLIVRNDADNTYYDAFNHTTGKECYILSIDSTNINLVRSTGGTFDDITFVSTSYNRAWLTFDYIKD